MYMSIYTVNQNENMMVNTSKSLPFIETHTHTHKFTKLNSLSIVWCELHLGNGLYYNYIFSHMHFFFRFKEILGLIKIKHCFIHLYSDWYPENFANLLSHFAVQENVQPNIAHNFVYCYDGPYY